MVWSSEIALVNRKINRVGYFKHKYAANVVFTSNWFFIMSQIRANKHIHKLKTIRITKLSIATRAPFILEYLQAINDNNSIHYLGIRWCCPLIESNLPSSYRFQETLYLLSIFEWSFSNCELYRRFKTNWQTYLRSVLMWLIHTCESQCIYVYVCLLHLRLIEHSKKSP